MTSSLPFPGGSRAFPAFPATSGGAGTRAPECSLEGSTALHGSSGGTTPLPMLHGCARENLDQAAADPHFLKQYDAVLAHFEDYMKRARGPASRRGRPGAIPVIPHPFFRGVRPSPLAAVLCRRAGLSGGRYSEAVQQPRDSRCGSRLHVHGRLFQAEVQPGWLVSRGLQRKKPLGLRRGGWACRSGRR